MRLRARPAARLEQAGSEITCWSCHAQVPVPVPVAPGAWVARLLTVTARQILASRTFTLLAIGAAMVTLALSITGLGLRLSPRALAWMPYPGVFAAAVALALVMVGYGELVRRGSQGDWTSAPSVGPWLRGWRGVLCLGVGVALVMPLIMATQNQTTPKLTPSGLAIALAATFVLPLVMLGTYVPDGSVLDRVRLVGSIVRRHPGALLASLLIVPVSLPAIEGLVWVLTRVTSTFSFMLFDLFPREEIRTVFRLPYYTIGPSRIKWLEFREASDALIMGPYGSSLRQGYALLGRDPRLARHAHVQRLFPGVGRAARLELPRLPNVLHPGDRDGYAIGPGRAGALARAAHDGGHPAERILRDRPACSGSPTSRRSRHDPPAGPRLPNPPPPVVPCSPSPSSSGPSRSPRRDPPEPPRSR